MRDHIFTSDHLTVLDCDKAGWKCYRYKSSPEGYRKVSLCSVHIPLSPVWVHSCISSSHWMLPKLTYGLNEWSPWPWQHLVCPKWYVKGTLTQNTSVVIFFFRQMKDQALNSLETLYTFLFLLGDRWIESPCECQPHHVLVSASAPKKSDHSTFLKASYGSYCTLMLHHSMSFSSRARARCEVSTAAPLRAWLHWRHPSSHFECFWWCTSCHIECFGTWRHRN